MCPEQKRVQVGVPDGHGSRQIVHLNGQPVSFELDSQGRVVAIELPNHLVAPEWLPTQEKADGQSEEATLADLPVFQRKRQRRYEPHVADLNRFADEIRKAHPKTPWFDPDDAGRDATVLVLLEAPSGNAAPPDGSGFVSAENRDLTAPTMVRIYEDVQIDRRRELVAWNVVPWRTESGDFDTRDIAVARPHLERLVNDLLPNLKAVVLLGRNAQKGWRSANIRRDVCVFPARHPSRSSKAQGQVEIATAIRTALATARRL